MARSTCRPARGRGFFGDEVGPSDLSNTPGDRGIGPDAIDGIEQSPAAPLDRTRRDDDALRGAEEIRSDILERSGQDR